MPNNKQNEREKNLNLPMILN